MYMYVIIKLVVNSSNKMNIYPQTLLQTGNYVSFILSSNGIVPCVCHYICFLSTTKAEKS